MYLSPRATSDLLSGLKRHTTLMQVSAASVMSAAVDGWSAASYSPTVRRLQGRGAGRAPHTELSADTGILAPEPDCYSAPQLQMRMNQTGPALSPKSNKKKKSYL